MALLLDPTTDSFPATAGGHASGTASDARLGPPRNDRPDRRPGPAIFNSILFQSFRTRRTRTRVFCMSIPVYGVPIPASRANPPNLRGLRLSACEAVAATDPEVPRLG